MMSMSISVAAIVSLAVVCSGKPLDEPVDSQNFRQVTLYSHNAKRAMHGSPPLVLNNELNDRAQAYADALANGDYSVAMQTAMEEDNMYWSGEPIAVTGEDPVNKWYAQINKYDFENPGTSPDAAAFQHLVWKRSTDLGVGVSKCQRGTTYTVAIYHPTPTGALPEDFEENIQKPSFV